MAEEWAQTAEDVLWRRSKLGLQLSQEQSRALTLWFCSNPTERDTDCVS